MVDNISSSQKFSLIMVSAMYENGGNTLHRFLDGHPQLYVYPFESQLGTPLISDYLTSVFPAKYRWPEFPLEGTFQNDYELIIDEELKRHIKTPFVSKFKDAEMQINDTERKQIFLRLLAHKSRTRSNIIEAFFKSTFLAWRNYRKIGKETKYVGYCPIIGVDTEKIFSDFPNAKIIHIVRNPFSAYADTKKRAVPYSLPRYIHTWNILQLYAINYAKMFPNNFIIIKFEDLAASPKRFFNKIIPWLGLRYAKSLEYPSWNGKKLEIIEPWGTIKSATLISNKQTKDELSQKEESEINKRTHSINRILGYE